MTQHPSEAFPEDSLTAIHAELRTMMNGVAARAIQESGMAYRLVYGVELPRLRQLAAEFRPDRRLAIKLWQQDVRECRMLAIMLMPLEDFDADMAEIWISDIRPQQAELAQLMSMDLIAHTPYASQQAFVWMADERPVQQLCGFLTITRLLMQGVTMAPDAEAEFIDQAESARHSEYAPLRRAAQNAIMRLEQNQDRQR